ncbi:MAG: adenylate/guanylate cyclase domain-containing protein, partial [Myxococcales bacterium]|nr:adenylate/guanylate cyclase domain-containing protein [Myxococcales bacterium]
ELNLYFSHMDPVVEAHGGVIDKRIGDGLMVVFTSSQRSGEGLAELQRRAVRCAVGMLTALPACNAQLGARGSEPIQIRVGVAGGPLVQGNVGSAARLEYTVIGDTVNLAARLEGQASPGCALIQEAVFAAGGAGHAPLSRRTIKVKGRVEPVAVVEVGIGEGALALGVSG